MRGNQRHTVFLALVASVLVHLLIFMILSYEAIWPKRVQASRPPRFRIVSVDQPKPKKKEPPNPESRNLADANRRESGAGKPSKTPRLKREREERIPMRRGVPESEIAKLVPVPQVLPRPEVPPLLLVPEKSPEPQKKPKPKKVQKPKPEPQKVLKPKKAPPAPRKPRQKIAKPKPEPKKAEPKPAPRAKAPVESPKAQPKKIKKAPSPPKPKKLARPAQVSPKPRPAKKPPRRRKTVRVKKKSPPKIKRVRRPETPKRPKKKVVKVKKPLPKKIEKPERKKVEKPEPEKAKKPEPKKVKRPQPKKKERVEVASLAKPKRTPPPRVVKPSRPRPKQPPIDPKAMFRAPAKRRGSPKAPKLELSNEDADRIAKRSLEKDLKKEEEGEAISLDTRDFRYASYFAHIKRRIQNAWTWPREARGFTGKLLLRFVLREDGTLKEVRLISSSGYRILDDEAMAAVTKAGPFKPFPPDFKRKLLPIEGTFVYERGGLFRSR